MIRINDSKCKATVKAAVVMSALLLFAAMAFGQQINLSAMPTTYTAPDGTVIPMWGYFCGAAVSGSTASCRSLNPNSVGVPAAWAASTAYTVGNTIVDSNGNVQIVTIAGTSGATAPTTWGTAAGALTTDGGGTPPLTWAFVGPVASYVTWSPVVITVPTGTSAAPAPLTINLTNNLSFSASTIPTSIVIVGQVGGGLGSLSTSTPSPSHTDAQGCPTWFIASGATPPGVPCPAPQAGTTGTPPNQPNRVQSMATEVLAAGVAVTQPGQVASGSALTWSALKPGTYLLESGTHPSIQVPMGLIGVLVVTTAPSGTTAGAAYPAVGTSPAVPYNAELPLEFSEIDPVQNKEVDQAVRTAGFSETAVWSGMNNANGAGGVGCGQTHTCYPPAVNYTPFYYLINGVAFNKNAPTTSLFQATAGTVTSTTGVVSPVTTGITGTVLVRLVNAGLRMHVPSIVNSLTQGFNGAGVPTTAANPVSGFTLIAEDGNVLPNVAPAGWTGVVPAAPRVQTDVLMVPSKVYDALINVPAPPSGATVTPALPVYDRQLSLSGNSSIRDAGMLAYISVNNAVGTGLPVSVGSGVFAPAQANNDNYNSLVAGQPFTVSDTSKGVIANDINVYGVTLLAPPMNGVLSCPAAAAVMGLNASGMCANGTFTWTPNSGSTATSDTFTYCANGTVTGTTCSSGLTATVTLNKSSVSSTPTAIAQAYTAKTAAFFKLPSPGLLVGNSDPSNLPLSIVTTGAAVAGLTLDSAGGFTVVNPTPSTTAQTTFTFSYTVQNTVGGTATGSVTVTFPVPSNLQVRVLDAQLYNNCNGNSTCISGLTPIGDYRWIIEEDKTFWVDPNCTTNSSITTPGCPAVVGTGANAGQTTIPTFGVNFHTSNMDYVAQGCTGPLSCEYGQTMICGVAGAPACPSGMAAGSHIPAVCDLGNGACRPDPGNGTTSGGFAWVNPSQVVLDPTKRYYISVLPGDAANPFPPTATAAGAPYAGPPVCSPTGGSSTVGTCGHTMSGAPVPPACNFLVAGCTSTSNVAFAPVNVLSLPTPLPTGRLSVIVFEDDFPLNGEQDGGGGNGTVAPIEPGLGGFNLVLWDTFGGLGDVTGQDTYDMFNMPLSNGLAGTIDPVTGNDACPVSATPLTAPAGAGIAAGATQAPPSGITGMIVTCPKYESDGTTLSPLAGQAVIYNLMPEKFSVQAYPGADRIARGEQWLQTNTLDGQHAHDSFIRIGEPSYFQEYGPAGYHVAIGFANPAIINARSKDVCSGNGTPGTVGSCNNTITGQVDVERISRTPDQRLYPSGSRDALAWTQCWVSLGDPDGEDFMFTFCDANGNFKFTGVPGGEWRLTIGDQWNDQIIDGLSTPVNVGTSGNGTVEPVCPGTGSSPSVCNLGAVGVQQWQANLYTRTFIDDNKNGVWDQGEIGIPFLYTRIYYRDGHSANGLNTDFNGIANFNETYPLFNWYVVEADSTRYKTTGIHTVYDAGGPADGSPSCGTGTGTGTNARGCGTSTSYKYFTNSLESVPLPNDLSVPGAVYCAKADCVAEANADFVNGTAVPSSSTASTGRIDPPWVSSEGWAGLTGLSNWIDFGKAPYAACNPALPASATNFCVMSGTGTSATNTGWGENGGIHGQVSYASTRPFDDASQMILQPWEPLVPGVTINLYQEGFAADGVTPTLNLVDTTVTSSWDAWSQGFYSVGAGATGSGALKPYMNCPGQGTSTGTNADLFYFTLFDQPNYLDWYNSVHNGGTLHTLPYNSQYKCYDSMHMGNQIQPAPYDGEYYFPSVLGIDGTSGKLVTTKGSTNGVTSSMAGTNCTICVPNPDSTDKFRFGTPMLPPGKYQVQVIMPQGYEVYKEEDKNLLIGDNFIAPVTQQFGGLGADIFIIPDQASVASLYDESAAGYNPNNFQDQTTALGLNDELSGVPGYPGFQDPVWPCVGEQRVVPDYLSLYPQAKEVAPFAGATRPLCDRKEVTLSNQMNVRMHFAIFTSTHIAGKFAGGITDDFTSEFDPFSPQFGEKFSPPNMPISTKDYLGNEISRVYSDHWGAYDGLTYSSWEVNPPNITGYSPTMMVQCMNDPGPILDTRTQIACAGTACGSSAQGTLIANPTVGQMITDPLFNPAYSNFCYEDPYMPGLTTYLDTPVVPTQAFVGAGYNNVDCSYPDTTPAIAEVDSSDGIGPWVSAAGTGHTLTITALGTVQVNNTAYSGPSANAAPFNMKTVPRHYGFGTQTNCSATVTTCSSVTIGGVSATISSWTDSQIVVQVPDGVPSCLIQQQAQYGGSQAQCGQLVITAGNGKQSIDTVTVTIGGKAPTHVNASGPNTATNLTSIQAAIDAAMPGDMIMIDPTCTTSGTTTSTTCNAGALHTPVVGQTASVGSHNELVIMWKPVRLQGVGAVSSVINATAFPAGKLLDPWRRRINCLFGLSLSGVPTTTGSGPGSYDPTGNYSCGGWTGFVGAPNNPQIDRLPLEATVGWDATQNGNLAEQLQEPSLMGAFEGAAITVLGKGVDFHGAFPWNDGNEGGAFPTVTTLLTGVVSNPSAPPGMPGGIQVGDNNLLCTNGVIGGSNMFPSNFVCNPSSIDGLTITSSSQGGGGIFAHGWAHFLQIGNNRVYNNAGTLTGGISVGQGEFPTPYLQASTTNAAPGSCSDGTGYVPNEHLPYCLQLQVNTHNNYITNNSSLGDELFSGTLSGGGGATFCTGNDYYKFNYNWVCGNLSAGEGGGIVHLGEIQSGDIEHNSIVFNQSENPTIPTNGGGIQIMGTPDTDPTCGSAIDADCPPGLSDGTGRNLTINANLIQGNMAESGSGGGIRLQQVNGTEVSLFPGNYPITAADAGRTVLVTIPGTAVPPALNDSVTIAGVSVAGYNGTFTVTGIVTNGRGIITGFRYFDTTAGLGAGTGGTFTDATTTTAGGAITRAAETGAGVVTITSTLPALAGDSVTITGLTPTAYDGTFTVTCDPTSAVSTNCPAGPTAAGTFSFNDSKAGLTAVATLPAPPAQANVTDANTNLANNVLWNGVNITNNIIANNVAGWDGAGISLQDALNVNIVNNTIVDNDTLASSGVLTTGIGAPDASSPNTTNPNCHNAAGSASCPQVAGLASTRNSSLLTTTFAGLTIMCPPGHYATGAAGSANNGTCVNISYPAVYNDLIYQNRAFFIGLSGSGTAGQNQQNLVSLFYDSGTPAPNQSSTGQCSGGTIWDIGVRGDTGPTNHGSGYTLGTSHTMTTPGGAVGGNNVFISSYCNGSRVPPECTVADGCGGPTGYGVPPGIADALTPNPRFSLTPSATVDEGNNWINVSWGPLSLSNASIQGPDGLWGGGLSLGNYGLAPNSPAIDGISTGETLPSGVTVPAMDFYGNPRPNPDGDGRIDYGAVETQAQRTAVTPTLTSITPASGFAGTTVNVTLIGTNLTGASAVNVSGGAGNGITVSGVGVVSSTEVVATFTIAANAPVASRNVSVVTPNGTTNTVAFAVTVPTPTLSGISPTSGERGAGVTGGTPSGIPVVAVTLTGNNLGAITSVTMTTGAPGPNGVACTGVVATATTVTANCTITRGAPLGTRNVTVSTGGGAGAVTATLNGAFTVTGATLTFSAPSPLLTTTPGTTTTKSGTITVTNTASGPTAAFNFTAAPTITGAPRFSIVTGGTCVSGFSLGAGSTCTIDVQYAPGTSTTTRSAHVTVTGGGLATATQNSPNFNAN